jgi:hypothetical protein
MQGNFPNLRSTVEEITQLSIKMCIADAVHDNTVVENVYGLQLQSLHLLNILAGQLRNIQDRASLQDCQNTCKEVIQEVEKDVLAVETEMVCQSTFTTKSTVISVCTFFSPWLYGRFACFFLLHGMVGYWRNIIWET